MYSSTAVELATEAVDTRFCRTGIEYRRMILVRVRVLMKTNLVYVYLLSLRTSGTNMHAAFPLLFCCEIGACYPRTCDAFATIAPPIRSGPSYPRSMSL